MPGVMRYVVDDEADAVVGAVAPGSRGSTLAAVTSNDLA